MFNALKYAEELEKAGFTQEQAKASLKLIIEVMNEEFATKSDVTILRSDLSSIRMELKNDISQFRTELRAEVAELRLELKSKLQFLDSKIDQMEYRLTIKLGGMIAISTGIMATIFRFIPSN